RACAGAKREGIYRCGGSVGFVAGGHFEKVARTHHTSRLPCSRLSRRRRVEQGPDAGGGLYRGCSAKVKLPHARVTLHQNSTGGTPMPPQLQSALGFAVLLLLCWLSGQRRRPPARVVIGGVVLQALVALLLIKLPEAQGLFAMLNNLMLALEESTRAGTSLVFGYLGGGDTPFDPSRPEHGYILAFRGLPLVLVMSALSALLFYWRILPVVVRGFSWLLSRSLGIGGPLGVGATANVFLGMVEAPLLIRPYLLSLHRG